MLNEIRRIAFVFCFVFASSLFATPSWFGKLQPTNPYELIGYGEGAKLEEARANARENLAKQIKVNIESKLTIDKKSSTDSYSKSVTQSKKENTNITLSELKELQQENEDGVWYVAFGYDNLLATTKLAQKIKGLQCDKMPHIYLSHTPFYEELATKSNLSNCVMPTFSNGVHYIGIQEAKVVFDFEKLLAPFSNQLTITTTKNNLVNGDSFALQIEAPKGYVSIFNVFEGGKVNVVVENLELKKDGNFVFPSVDDDFELTAQISTSRAIEGYFAISSPKKLNLSLFGESNFQNQTSGRYRFDEFLKLIERYPFGSTVVNIRGKNKK